MNGALAPMPAKRKPTLEKISPEARLDQSFARPAEAADPIAIARRDLNKVLPPRLYKEVTVKQRDGTFILLLDGRAAKSPGGNLLAPLGSAAARALAKEWSVQNETIDPAVMPLTRIVNSAIDGVAYQLGATVDEIARYAWADLVCYRAAGPRTLIEAQAAEWSRVIAFARENLGAHFICTEGAVFVEQPEPAPPFALAALHVMTTLTGSVLLALAVARSALTPLRPGLPRMSMRILKCAPGARTRRLCGAGRGNGARWKRPHACFRPSMALEHERVRVFAK
jgi:chaperone required for assembly of F1-ATPase